jgi:septal ring-binding cell division protein DamX
VADSGISIVDRYSGKVAMGVVLPAPPADLRMDPLGRYLLAQFPKGDSAWVIAIGTNRLVGAVPTRWATDLPVITPDGSLALLSTKDVTLVDPEKLSVRSTVTGGAKDFWYFFAWDGFRPRPQGLDQPVTFPGDSVPHDSLAASSTPSTSPPAVTPPADTPATVAPGTRPSAGFTVQFAALLTDDKAQELASTIKVGANSAHVNSSTIGGSPIFRVVMGPFATKDEAEKVGRASKRAYWVYEGSP